MSPAAHTSPTLSLRLDEAAATMRAVLPVRALLDVMAGVVGILLLPAAVTAVWLAGALALEVWTWAATRRPGPSPVVSGRARASFAACYLTTNLWWILLGAMLVGAGTVASMATGAVLLLAVGSVFLMLFHNAPPVFLIAGAAPATAALSVIALADGRDWRELLPVALALCLATIFSLGRALDTPSAQQQQRRLNDSLNKFETLAENVTDIIIRTDLEGVHQYVSPASLAILGYRPEELLGARRQDIIHPESWRPMAEARDRMLANPGQPEVLTARVRHKDGHWVWLQTSAKLVLENGVAVGVIDVSRDVTARVAAEHALHEAKIEAEAANRAKAEFLANVSHEIRTPMNGVLGALHLLEREPISPEGRELMRQAQDGGRMLSQLLNDVLDFSKIEAGQLDLSPEPIDAGETLRAVCALLEGQAHAKGVDLSIEIAGEDLWIEADPVRLRQAMFNLLGNAVKFTVVGRVTARLTVTEAGPGRRHVRLEVEDTGIGLTAEARQTLFDRFSQAEGDIARRFGGTGLGLAITQALARLMGGALGFDSVEGEGSTFWLAFDAPAARAPAVAVEQDELLEGLHILLVEDNPTNRLVARTLLTRLGARVEEAEDGVIGFNAARGGGFDLILMDVQMPHMDGIEATREIRGLKGPAGRVPIIGLTANVMVHQRAEYRAAGMNGVVAKPISPAVLLGEIVRLLSAPEPEAAPERLEGRGG
ncbi:MAG: ATP-binding protein [Pseudomonadota bacterium]